MSQQRTPPHGKQSGSGQGAVGSHRLTGPLPLLELFYTNRKELDIPVELWGSFAA